jgi:hypothetical protein
VVEAGALGLRARRPQVEPADDLGDDRPQLEHRQVRADAAALAAAERDPGVGGDGAVEEALGTELVGRRVAARVGMDEREGGGDVPALGQRVAAELEWPGEDPRRVDDHRPGPQRLLDDRVEVLVAAGVELVAEPAEDAGVADEPLEGPGEGRRSRLVPGLE